MRFFSSRWLKIGVSLGLFAILLRSADWRLLIRQVSAARLDYFLLAFVGYLVSQAMYAYKWRVLARPLGFDQPWRSFATYYFVGMYLNLFAPSTVVGDVGRGLLLASGGGSVSRALQSVVVDRASGVVMLLWVSAFGFVLFGPTVLPVSLYYGTIATAGLAVAAWWVLPYGIGWLGSPQHRLRQFLEQVLAPYRAEGTAVLSQACGLAFVFHLFQLSLHIPLVRALGLPIPFWYLMLFIPLIHILSALPISFGGAGVREWGYVGFLALIGIGKAEATAFGLLWTAVVFGSGLVGGLVLLSSPATRLSLKQSAVSTELSAKTKTEG